MTQRRQAILLTLFMGLQIIGTLIVLGPLIGENQFAKGGITGFVVVANIFLFNRFRQKQVSPTTHPLR